MGSESVQFKIKINLTTIIMVVTLLHLILMFSRGLPELSLKDFLPKDKPVALKIRRVKTDKVTHPFLRPMDSVLEASGGKSSANSPVSLKDLSLTEISQGPSVRPGTRPTLKKIKTKEMNSISLKSNQFKDFSKSFPSGGLALSDMISGAQKVSDAIVSIEVPDGIKPDELNEYELMFYGFQKRTALNYVNAILKNLNKFQKTHPRYKLPSSGKINMTARITYDPEGNVKQIKMIRWTHVNEMQNLFEDIVKSIDQLHNPPKKLWERDSEFSMYYTLEILNG